MNNFKLHIAKNHDEFNEIFRLLHRTFVADQNYVQSDQENILTDEWDKVSIHVFCKSEEQIVGDGRLIPYSPLGLRVSSSIELERYFTNLNEVCQLSALAVLPEFRHLSIGNAIHYFRIMLALKLKFRYVTASCFPEIAEFLIEIGFEIVVDRFVYKRYSSGSYSVFLALDLKSETSLQKMNDYFKRKLSSELISQIHYELNIDSRHGYVPD